MRKLLTTFVCVWFTLAVWAGDGIYEKLQQIPQISEIQKLDVKPFQEYYQFWFEQPVDHSDPAKGTFRQRVLLGHKQSDAPVIVELEGYNIWSSEEGELANILKGNQLTIEHRFFDQSVPEGGIPWENLTIKQAADDQHEIIQAIRQKIYPASKWISTGISKGGQTTIFHRYFYPADVDISVPYVAPLNLEYVDPRLDKFLNRLGTAKSGVKALFNWEDLNTCHYTIRDFQTMCFEHLDTLLPMLEELAAEKKYTYRMVGGTKRALQLMILLQQIEIWSLLFVVAETLLFKAIVVPAILFAVIRRTKINRIAASGTSQFNSLVLSLAALVASISVTYCIAEETINLVFFGVALYALLSGLILIVVRTRIFSHMVGFLVIENGVFLFSMAVGVEMPSMIEIAIILDILISILMLGLFLTKIGARFRIGDTDLLTNVKD